LKKKRKQLMVRFDADGKKENHEREEERDEDDDPMGDKELSDKKAGNYFFDYNTVEATLLACAVLICLIGVMFESGRFNEDRQDLAGQVGVFILCC
jgi:hypothetical protein